MTRDPALDATAAAELAAWRTEYAARLAGARGWWAVTALAWLEPRPAVMGSAADAALPLPARCPDRVALAWRDGDTARLRPLPGAQLALDGTPLAAGGVGREGGTDVEAGEGSVLRIGAEEDAVEAVLLRRGERLGWRVFDPRAAHARRPGGVAWFGVRPGWVVDATFVAADEGDRVPIVNLLGDVVEAPVAGRLRFTLAGAQHELLATPAAEDALFVHFRDGTSGASTYGAGRFLTVAAPRGGRTQLDFHRAHLPPCAHTPHATCPLPPLTNRLRLPVEAGERLPAG